MTITPPRPLGTPPREGNSPDLFPSLGGVPKGRGGTVSNKIRATKKYKSLPFNPALKKRAKELRKAGILHEALLWLQLKNNHLNGLDFDRQKIIGNYIVDFYCAEKGVVLEVDGGSHDHTQPEDALRDAYLHSLNLIVIRLLAKDVLQNMEGVVAFLESHPALTGTPPMEGN
jgi:very-short-patch-repair endonuclease